MIYQTDKEFPSAINHFGCYFMSLLYQIDQRFQTGFDHDFVNGVYNHETADHDIGDECLLNNAQGVCDFVKYGKIKYLGHFDPVYLCAPDEFDVQAWFNPRTDFTHFMAGDGKFDVAYDPIEGGSVTRREGHLLSKRIFKLL